MNAVKEKKSNKLQKIMISVIVVLALALVFLVGVNHWSVDMHMTGNNTIQLECGDSYEEEGVCAIFHGSLLCADGWEVPVTVKGEVETNVPGDYTVTYSAGMLFWQGKAERNVSVIDTQPPMISLEDGTFTLPGEAYEEDGYTATDICDGDLTDKVVREEKDGKVYYSVTDSSGNKAEAVRVINYDDPIAPELTLEGEEAVTLQAGKKYKEPGFTATDNLDGDLTQKVKVNGEVDTYSAGEYELVYSVKDSFGNVTKAKRTVTVEAVPQPDTVKPDGKIIYLTFDDGPGPYTEDLLKTLAKYNVKATFFTCNTGFDSILKKEFEEGHTVAIHSATHNYSKIYKSEKAYFSDLKKQQDVIYDNTGVRSKLVRFPGGSSNSVSKKYCKGLMTKLSKDLTDQGYKYFDWNVLSGDAGETTSTQQVFKNITNGCKQHDISIVLQHDIQDFSVKAVEKVLIWGIANGYTFLPLDESSPTVHHEILN